MKKSLTLVFLLAPVLWLGAQGIYHSRSTADSWLTSETDGYRLLDTSWTITFNPYNAEGGNDGAAWQGKGWNSWLWAGVEGKWGLLSLTLEPQIWFAQNANFTLIPTANSDGLGDYWYGLDWLQRNGRSVLLKADWGNTEVRLSWKALTIGLGTEAIWLGSAFRNGILMSNNAGGAPHLDLGTLVPLKTDWGTFEGKMFWGLLVNSSGVYDRFLHGLAVSYAPPLSPDLTLGAARVFYSPVGTVSWWKAFQSVDDGLLKSYRGIGGDEDVDQLAALYLDWRFPAVGFHLYAEVARNDHSGDFKDLMVQPDHAGGYVFGLDHSILLEAPWSVFYRYEQSDLGLNMGTTIRPTGSWYRRGAGEAGYTLNGQLLGASIGPGSNSQTLELGGAYGGIRLSILLERVAKDLDYWLKVIALQPHDLSALAYADVGYRYGLKGVVPYGPWELSVLTGISTEYDRNFELGMDSGLSFSTTLVYRW